MVGPLWGPPGNVVAFDADVLIVKDRHDDNRFLMERHPGRKGYLFVEDHPGGPGRLIPLGGPGP